ncbi:hypothetical protein [Catenuloplanes indicus]|uniref:Uncharacterized protein n=1 Tax=Catenuloplanes indicus TaxID=137267 RepID=A0AAE3W5Q4_9ACTN|nr:hypothetical protein [Catenuloplanes indicus]MDQ0368875.1 hypothetical protein [Catenuloplanes indicus]
MNAVDMAQEADRALLDVRAVSMGDLVTPATPDLDSALDRVLRDLPATEENLAAFGSAP